MRLLAAILVMMMVGGGAAYAGPKLRQVVITDPLFNKPAFTVSIPDDWSFEGTVLHGAGGPRAVFRARSADGLTGVQMLPLIGWVWSNDKLVAQQFEKLKMTVRAPISAADFLKTVVLPVARPDAKIGDVSPVPTADKLREIDKQTNEQFVASAGGGAAKHRTSDSARVRIQHGLAGHAVDEAMSAVLVMIDTPSPRGGVIREAVAMIVSTYAPHGTLDAVDPSLVAILMSVAPDPAWTKRMGAFLAQQAQAQNAQLAAQAAATQRAIMAHAAAARAANQRVFDASMANAKRMEDARHMGAQDTVDHIRDEKTAVNPQTGEAGKVSNQYNYSYVDDAGKVVQTNSPTFDPNAQLAGHWITLETPKP